MDIIKHGSTARAFRCEACGCEFIAVNEDYDVKWIPGAKFCTATCPECGNYIDHIEYIKPDGFGERK